MLLRTANAARSIQNVSAHVQAPLWTQFLRFLASLEGIECTTNFGLRAWHDRGKLASLDLTMLLVAPFFPLVPRLPSPLATLDPIDQDSQHWAQELQLPWRSAAQCPWKSWPREYQQSPWTSHRTSLLQSPPRPSSTLLLLDAATAQNLPSTTW